MAMIRRASMHDGAAMVAMAERFHSASPGLSRFRFSRIAAAQTFQDCIESPDCLALVLDIDGACGALFAQLIQFPLSSDRMAKEIVFWIEPRARSVRWANAMIRAYEDWARAGGATIAGLSCFADGRTEKLFLRHGYELAEQNTLKEL